MPTLPPHVRAEEPIRESTTNGILDALRPLVGLIAGSGITITRSSTAIAIALARLIDDHIRPAIVTEVVYLDGDTANNTQDNIRYTVHAIASPTEKMTAAEPVYGRRYPAGSGGRIQPAAVKHLCFIVRLPNGDGGFKAQLWILSERVLTRTCPAPLPGSIGARLGLGIEQGIGQGDGTGTGPTTPDGGGSTVGNPGGNPPVGGGGGDGGGVH